MILKQAEPTFLCRQLGPKKHPVSARVYYVQDPQIGIRFWLGFRVLKQYAGLFKSLFIIEIHCMLAIYLLFVEEITNTTTTRKTLLSSFALLLNFSFFFLFCFCDWQKTVINRQGCRESSRSHVTNSAKFHASVFSKI